MSPEELREHYITALNPAFVHSNFVLRDICSFCDLLSPFDYNPEGRNAALDLARAEGRREVALYILDQIGENSLRILAQVNFEKDPQTNDRPSSDAADDGDPFSD